MTSDTLFDALEICLQALDQGADVESCLVRYPALADELRPILIAAVQARAASVMEVPTDVLQYGKARVLQAAAEMREQQAVAPSRLLLRKKGFFGARFFRLAVTTVLVIAFLLTGWTGLVNASSGALPGDRLYPVKRSWEGVQLVFVFDQRAKEELEHKFDHERVQEIEELYSEKRFEQVNFEGVVQSQQKSTWVIGGLNIAIENETVYSGEILPGATVQVIGETDDGIIKAERITLIATPGVTPFANPTSTVVPQGLPSATSESEENLEESQSPETGGDSGSSESNKIESTKPPDTSDDSDDENNSNIATSETPRPHEDDSDSEDKSGDNNSQPTSEEHQDEHND